VLEVMMEKATAVLPVRVPLDSFVRAAISMQKHVDTFAALCEFGWRTQSARAHTRTHTQLTLAA
jgi:hypothetical protein